MYVFWKMKWDKHINKLAKVKDFLIIFVYQYIPN
jgi:hypothetical protein